MHKKFAQVDHDTRQLAMSDYLSGDYTTKEIGEKYGFAHRRLRCWFDNDGRLDDFECIAKSNKSKSSKTPMTIQSKLMISGIKSINWTGKKLDTKNGVVSGVLIPAPTHSFANKQGYVYEHRLVMEEYLERYLTRDEVIHHIDLDPINNNLDNLIVLTAKQHSALHMLLQHALVKLLNRDSLVELTTQLVDFINIDYVPSKKRDRRCGADG